MKWTLYPVSDFPEFKHIWQKLNKIKGNSPLLDPIFIQPLIDNFAEGNEKLAIYGAPEDPDIMAIIRPAKKGVWETFQSSNAPLGLWLSKENSFDAASARSLIKALPGTSISLGLTQQDPLFLERPQTEQTIGTLDYIETAHIDFPESFEDYWAGRGKNLRHNMKRQRNFLNKNDIETRLELWDQKEQMEKAVLDYARIESAGWKGQINSAVSGDDPQSLFYMQMLKAFSHHGEALVLRYCYNDELVATDLCLLRDKIVYILKTTYDEKIKGTSPAHIMRLEYYQTAVASGALKRVEFYGPLKEWHKKWTPEIRTIYHVNIYRNFTIAWLYKIAKLMG